MSTENNNQTLIERLFGAGAHFGFSKSRRHPTVSPYIYGSKHGTDIINLESSAAHLTKAKSFLEEQGKNGKSVLFVATKEEISPIVTKGAQEVAMPYVTNRWIGGMLTNFSEIKKRIERLKHLVSEKESGELERKYVKKERGMINREIEKLTFNFGGMVEMEKRPDVLVVVDPRHESIAIAEANELNIPIVAVMSSDCNASTVQYPVVVNDSLRASVSLAINELVAAYKTGAAAYTPQVRTSDRKTEGTRTRSAR